MLDDVERTRRDLLDLYEYLFSDPDERAAGHDEQPLDTLSGMVASYVKRIIDGQTKEIERLKALVGEKEPFVLQFSK